MSLKTQMANDLNVVFFAPTEFADFVDFVTAGVSAVPCIIEYGADPLIQQPNAATRATLYCPKTYLLDGISTATPTVEPGDVVRFDGKDWLVDTVVSQGGDVTVIEVRRKEGAVR